MQSDRPPSVTRPPITIAEMGELALIERLKPFCANGIVGDDAALVDIEPGYRLVVTTDVLVESVHFSDRTTPPFSVGWRAAAANLSDLAAMGAEPLAITVGLGLPGETSWPWVEALYQGMAACLKTHGGAIIGGDLCRAAQQTVSITALGQVQPEQAIRRSAAVPGMSVVVTGPHGASRAGLALLLGEVVLGEVAAEASTASRSAWIKAHRQPVPRFDAIARLHQLSQPSENFPPIAGMDSSDGLANALLQIAHSSGVGMEIERSRIPLPAQLSNTVGAETALEWALYGGEDFELVLCMPPNLAGKFTSAGFAVPIGTVTPTKTVQLISSESGPGIPLTHQSFQHF